MALLAEVSHKKVAVGCPWGVVRFPAPAGANDFRIRVFPDATGKFQRFDLSQVQVRTVGSCGQGLVPKPPDGTISGIEVEVEAVELLEFAGVV